MRFFYDCEFIEDGTTIDLVSIGIVSEDGREFYAVSSEFDQAKLQANPFLVEHVWPSLPRLNTEKGRRCRCRHGHLDLGHPDVRSREQIARGVLQFLFGEPQASPPSIELWAWFAAYDHVTLAQLWGPMIKLPRGVPQLTGDLKQEAMRLGNPRLPEQTEGVHNALADARHNVVRWNALRELTRPLHHAVDICDGTRLRRLLREGGREQIDSVGLHEVLDCGGCRAVLADEMALAG